MKTYSIPNTEIRELQTAYLIMQNVSGANLQGINVDPDWMSSEEPR